jgi:hypothetical protein
MTTFIQEQPLVIGAGFTGVPEVAHGGYVAGLMARALESDSADVRLRRPVPIDREIAVQRPGNGTVHLHEGETLLAQAAPADDFALAMPAAVSFAEATEASKHFLGHHHHPFPYCLVCGPERHEGDGLRIFPGAVAGRELVAAPWVPAAALADDRGELPGELVSAALDCAQLWALIAHSPADSEDRVVTAALSVKLLAPVQADQPHVVVGWPIGRNDRGWTAGAAVVGPNGELCAIGSQMAAITNWGVPLGYAS